MRESARTFRRPVPKKEHGDKKTRTTVSYRRSGPQRKNPAAAFRDHRPGSRLAFKKHSGSGQNRNPESKTRGRLRRHTIKANDSLFRVTGAPDRDERARPHAFAVTGLVLRSSPAPRGAQDRRPGNTAARIFTGIPKPVPAKTRKRRTARNPSRRRPFPPNLPARKVFSAASEEKSSFGRSLFPEFPLDPPGEDHRTDG